MAAALSQGPNEFELARKRAAQQNAAATQQQGDALKRRYAAMGNLNSGAYTKANQLASDDAQRRLQDANEGIDTAERAENRRIREVQEGREFASKESALGREFARQERLGGQDFQGSMLGRQQEFMRGERLGGQEFQGALLGRQQDFARGEREASQGFMRGEREAGQGFAADQSRLGRDLQTSLFDRDMSFKRDIAGQEQGNWTKQMDLAERQFKQDQETTAFNRWLAEREANKKGGIVNDLGNELGFDMGGDGWKGMLGRGAILGPAAFTPGLGSGGGIPGLGGGGGKKGRIF